MSPFLRFTKRAAVMVLALLDHAIDRLGAPAETTAPTTAEGES